eukprot:9482455-Pyramimonas_sp.AAC.1
MAEQQLLDDVNKLVERYNDSDLPNREQKAACDAILKRLEQAGLAYREKIAPKYLGPHMSNRYGD